MLRNPVHVVKENPHNLENVPSDLTFWKKLGLKEIKNFLWEPLIAKEVTTALPKNDDLQALLESVALCLNQFRSEAMISECFSFMKDVKSAHVTWGAGQIGERYLQVSAAVNFYLGRYQEAANLAGILSDVYFMNHHFETDLKGLHFSLMASVAYQKLDNIEKANHHYSLYVANRCRYQYDAFPAELRVLDNPGASKPSDEQALVSIKAAAQAAFPEWPFQYQYPQTTNMQEILATLKIADEKRLIAFTACVNAKECTDEEKMNLTYNYLKETHAIRDFIANLDKQFVNSMSLVELHILLNTLHKEYPGYIELFKNNANAISAKLQNFNDFICFLKYSSDASYLEKLCNVLLTHTTGDEHTRLHAMVDQELEKRKVTYWQLGPRWGVEIREEAKEAFNLMQQRMTSPAITSGATSTNLFAPSKINTTVNEQALRRSSLIQ